MPADSVKDLGVIMSNDGSFQEHISKICDSANRKIGWFLRSFQSRDSELMRFIWQTYIQPGLDYCSQLWSLTSPTQLMKVENVLCSFTSRIMGIQRLNYWERLKCLNLLSMQQRMERYRLIYTWKILEEQVPNCGIQWNSTKLRGRLCSVPSLSNASEGIKTKREQSFQIQGPKLFNCLPRYLRDKTGISVDIWMRDLDKFLAQIPDTPVMANLTPGLCNQSTACPSNSLGEWIPDLDLNGRRQIPAEDEVTLDRT